MVAPTQTPPQAACFYVLEGAMHGPVSEAALDALRAEGVVGDDTQVRTPHAAGWQTYGERHASLNRPPPLPKNSQTRHAPGEADDGTGPRHLCAACKKDWPESLMLMNDRRWLCRSCFYGKAMNARRQHDKTRRDWWKWLRTNWRRLGGLAATLSALGFLAWHYRHELPFDFFDDEDPAESWAKLPQAQWPQLAFTNRADFHRHSTLRGQAIFFARRGDNTVVAATAAHLLTTDAGVVPDMAPSEVESTLRTWWAYPPGQPDRAVAIAGLYGDPADLHGFDMLFLKLAADTKVAPITSLRLARREARAGEKVFVVAPAAPADPKATGARQVVLPGWVHVKTGAARSRGAESKEGNLLDVHMDPAIVPQDLGGAPVIDERGHLVGIVKGWGDPQDAAGHVNTVVAQGAVVFRQLLEPKDQPAAKGKPEAQGGVARVEKMLGGQPDK